MVFNFFSKSDPRSKIDHIHGDPDDNRWGNLRASTQLQNTWNQKIRSTTTSGHNCIYPLATKRASSKKFRVLMQIEGRKKLIGDFHTLEEAKAAYDAAFTKYRDPAFKR
jgi:hypothetical protein